MKRINKTVVLALTVLCLLFAVSCARKAEESVSTTEPEAPAVQPGRIIVLVVDISQSISRQLDDIVDGLCKKIVDERLEADDYCVVVPLGDASNSDKADSFGIKYSTDKEKTKNYLNTMKTWMPGNLNTDIGAAMRKTFQYVNMIKKENNGNMSDPLVLFITDGEIYHSKNSGEGLLYETPDSIFADPMMNPETASYENWWFLGIENEGVPLVHIKSIAQRVGAYPDRYETLTDMSQFGVLFDKWLERIQPVKPKDNGRITFYDVRLGDRLLSTQNGSYTVLPNNSDLFTWMMRSEYKFTDVVLNFKNVKGTFQKDSTGETVEFQVVPEAGNIEFSPGAVRETRGNMNLPGISGKGKLKLTIDTELNSESEGQIPEYLFFVELKSPFMLLAEKVLPFACIIIVAILVLFILKTLKDRKPVKIKLEVVGKKSAKVKSVPVKINRSVEFGSKVGIALKIDSPNIPPVVGKIVRTGKRAWKIEPKEESFFAPNQKLDPYSLSSTVKLVAKDGSNCSVKFSQVR